MAIRAFERNVRCDFKCIGGEVAEKEPIRKLRERHMRPIHRFVQNSLPIWEAFLE